MVKELVKNSAPPTTTYDGSSRQGFAAASEPGMSLAEVLEGLHSQGVSVSPTYLAKWLSKQVEAGKLCTSGHRVYLLPEAEAG